VITVRSEQITLISGDTRSTIFADMKVVGVTEYYQAQQVGDTAELKCEVYRDEFDGQKFVELGGKRYRVIRVGSAKNPDKITLTLSDLSQGGDGMVGLF